MDDDTLTAKDGVGTLACESLNPQMTAVHLTSSHSGTSVDPYIDIDHKTFKEHVKYHLNVMKQLIEEQKNQLRFCDEKHKDTAKNVNEMQCLIRSLESKLNLKSLTKFIAKQTDVTNTASDKFNEMIWKFENGESKSKDEMIKISAELQDLQQRIQLLLTSIQSPSTDLPRNNPVENIDEMFVDRQYATFNRQAALYNKTIKEMDIRFQVLESTSYNGCLVWRIQDYYQRKHDAKYEGRLSLYSQPFYTSSYGYKMCACIHLNGNGAGKDSHLSLYFVVMKGQYDSLLPWPFRQRVTMMCLDQSRHKRHVKDEFVPDPNSTSIIRPTNDINIVSGSSKFVLHSVVENSNSYIQDDVLFIKIVVDISNLEI